MSVLRECCGSRNSQRSTAALARERSAKTIGRPTESAGSVHALAALPEGLFDLFIGAWLSAYTAQIVAGNQPITVICRIRQITPAIGRPMVKKVSQGKINAISRRIFAICK